MRGFAGSLRGQLILLIVTALVIAQAVSIWLFVDERSLAVRAALGLEAAGRAISIARLLDEAPPELRDAILRAADSPLVRFELGDRPLVDHRDHGPGRMAESRILGLMGGASEREIRIELHEIDNAMAPMAGVPPQMARMHRNMARGRLSVMEMRLSLALKSGQWLNVGTRIHRPPLQWPWLPAVSFGLSAAVLLIAVFWFVLTRLTGPLRNLSAAADRLGRGEDVEPLPATGPAEMRQLTNTFNRMQARLTRFVADRTRLLAALGHDLRSPLTALRVRAEMVDDDETRERMIASISEMQDMVDSTLAFARGMAISEPSETVDLAEFLDNLCGELNETGGDLSFTPDARPQVRARVNALRRALRNVIENALRYGGTARIGLSETDGVARISIADDGPGIPDDQLERVFDPFVRLESSRSRETGGTGLGLSIARTVIQAHGGEIRLQNRAGGGLTAYVELPLENFD